MMFTRATLKNLTHKTKKSLMLKIGQTESQPEEPEFKHLLTTLSAAKRELKEIYDDSRRVASSGRKFNENLEKLLGFGLRSEDVFNKDVEFLATLEERVCTALGRIVNKDVNTLNEAIVHYKKAKLKFDALHFKTVKKLRKEENKTITYEDADEVMEANVDLPDLHEEYVRAKDDVRSLRDVIVTHLKTKVVSRLEELRAVSNTTHHQLYCKFFEDRLKKTVEICSEEPNEQISTLVRSNTFSHHRSSIKMQNNHTPAGGQNNDENIESKMVKKSFSSANDDEKDAERQNIGEAMVNA